VEKKINKIKLKKIAIFVKERILSLKPRYLLTNNLKISGEYRQYSIKLRSRLEKKSKIIFGFDCELVILG
jgi:DNA polymerase II small subunit/DNA polymerase delta subunit B